MRQMDAIADWVFLGFIAAALVGVVAAAMLLPLIVLLVWWLA